MFQRSMIRTTFATLRLSRTVALHSKLYNPCTSNRISVSVTNSTGSQPLYSTQPELLTVDYDYVKEATSNKNILIVDVREPDEVKEHGKIPNSINIPLGQIATALGTMPDKEFEQSYQITKPSAASQIIFYCMIGKRSGKAQEIAINAGYKNVKNYVGSWLDWASKSQS